jgi:hypothetical protein
MTENREQMEKKKTTVKIVHVKGAAINICMQHPHLYAIKIKV